jgi:nucleoside-diphosphate kinase
MLEQTLVILKPEAIEDGLVGEIIARFEENELTIIGMKMCRKTEAWVEQHYQHLEPEILENVKKAMSGPLIGIVFEGQNAASKAKSTLGCTDPKKADVGTIRGDLCSHSLPRNLAHAADTDLVDREIELFSNPLTDIQ